MPDDEDTELQKVMKKMNEQLADEIAARKELEKELRENKKKIADLENQLNPPDEEEKPATTDESVKKMAEYIDEEKKAKEAKHKRKVERYRVRTSEESEKEAAELFHKMLMDAAEEE